jgi:TRAP-type C4-dicarboxylate transport system permease small subunit
MSVLEWLNQKIRSLAAVFMGVMALLVIVQVFFRYVLGNPLTGSQELAVFSMVWVVMLGATIAFRNRSHIAVNLVVDLFPSGVQRCMRCLSYALILAFLSILGVQGWALTTRAMMQIAPSTHIPVGCIAVSIPICALVSSLYILEMLVREVRGGGNASE